MPGERLSMRKIRDVLRLRHEKELSQRAIGQSLRISLGAVNTCLNRARLAGLGWPLPEGLDDVQLEARLYPPPPAVASERRPVPDWAVVHRELRRRNMTLALLWEEYRNGPGGQDGFGYSWFCDLYREWAGRLKPTLRQVHPAGERVFVDLVSVRIRGVFMPRRPERQSCRSRGQDTISRRAAGACHRARAFGSVAAGGRRAWSTASAGVWRSVC